MKKACFDPLAKKTWLFRSPARCLKSKRALLIFYKALFSFLTFPPSPFCSSLLLHESLSPLSISQWRRQSQDNRKKVVKVLMPVTDRRHEMKLLMPVSVGDAVYCRKLRVWHCFWKKIRKS